MGSMGTMNTVVTLYPHLGKYGMAVRACAQLSVISADF